MKCIIYLGAKYPLMKSKLYPIIIFLSVLFFASCKTDKKVPAQDDKLDIAIKREPKMIHPIVNPLSSSRPVYQNVFLPMADFHPDSHELVPILITELPVASEITEGPFKGGTKYTIEFRKEAKWDNGDPITAKDLEFSQLFRMHFWIKYKKQPRTCQCGESASTNMLPSLLSA